MTGADRIVEALEAAGVTVVFGLPGVHNLALWEALRESSIRLVGVRHEQAAAYAADGYFRATGRVGVALTTTGPGAANTLGAVGEAFASRSGLLVIATNVATAHRDRLVLHGGVDQAAMFAPVVGASFFGPEATGGALAAADGCPVYLEIATDALR
jgi:acetolactate synthase-1/2/3 large subunit